MKLAPLNSFNVLSILVIVAPIIAKAAVEHVNTHYGIDFPHEALTLKERFFNDVMDLIKRQSRESGAIKKLSLNNEKDLLNKELLTSKFDIVYKTNAYVPTPVLVDNWPASSHSFGQITAVSIDPQGNPTIFHRANRDWNANTFNDSNIYYLIENGPIQEKTIYVLDPRTGSIKSGWGENLFYMPHGMTIDIHGNYWITDVALHQVFKMATSGSDNADELSQNVSIVLSNSTLKLKILSGELKISQKRGRSKVWNMFGKIENMSGEEIPNVVACKSCFNIYKSVNNSTSNLVKHKCYIEANNEVKNTPKVEVHHDTKTILLNIFTEWTIENCRPFKIVEDSGFIKLAECLISIGAKYGRNVDIKSLLPHPTTISRNITKIHSEHFVKVKTEIASVKNNGFGLTSDLWKDDYLKKSYLSLTIQYIKEGILKSRLLGMKCMKEEKCTSDKIKTKVCTILKEFDLNLDNKAIIVTDRGSNMVAGFRANNHIYCIDHLLHNTVQKSMQDISDVAELSRMCTKLVKYFKVSGLNSNLNTTLKSYSPTRWNSIYRLFVSVEANWPNIIQILQEKNELSRIHNINLSHITAIIKVLEPFEEAFTKLEGENYVTIHLVYMIVHHLQKKCISNNSDLEITKLLKEKLSAYLGSIVLQNLTIYHKMAVFLFPPANRLFKFSEDEKTEIKDECRRIMTTYLQELPLSENQNEVPVERSMGEFYFDYVQAPQNDIFFDPIENEMSKYENLNLSNFSNDFNVLQWWNMHKTEYPLLYKLSCQILATPASSAASERVFSSARNLIAEKRCIIAFNGESINAIMFLHSNIKKN